MIVETKLNLELAKEYYKLAIKASLGFYCLLALFTYFYWDKVSSPVLFTWVGFNFFTATLFLITSRLFKLYGNEENAASWLRLFTYLALVQDIPWGLIGPISYSINIDVYLMLSLFMLGGITAGGLIARAIIYKNYVISLISLLLPTSIILVIENTDVARMMLGMVLIYFVFMLFVAKDYSLTINRNIQLWLANEKLVTELRSSNVEVEEAKERAEQANHAKSQFLATISHELRTPLNGIMGFTELLQSEQLESKYRQFVDQIAKAGKTLLNIVNDILDIAAIEEGHIRFHEESFSLRSEINDLLTMLKPIATEKGLSLALQVDEEVEDVLCGDVSRLRQIVGNLLSNGLKYTETGYVSLNISVLEKLRENHVLRFEIKDTGIGIPADKLSSIFENFTRLEGFETRRNEGTGLGLAIVKNLVNRLGGKLYVQSEVGKGSSFSIELTIKSGTKNEANATHHFLQSQAVEQLAGLKVLVVDDNDINRKLLSAFLKKMGATYSEAANGHEALDQMRCESYDVVLLDIQMPDITGIDVATQVLLKYPEPPILIAITAHAFPEQRKAILDAGFTDFLIKPVEMSVLLKMLRQAYNNRFCEKLELTMKV